MTSSENINSFWASLVVEELVRSGVILFCISPGSRSAPLTVAVARNPQAQSVICNDERGAAFFAIGYAKATGVPAALISTSGTAAANYFPAVIEAAMDAAPMILLTADRPPELLETGANQTIRQNHLFDGYLNWRFTLPCPDDQISPAFVLSTMDWAVARAVGMPPGPVHINMMFREPLTPIPRPFLLPQNDSFKNWETSRPPWAQYQLGHAEIAEGLPAEADLVQGQRHAGVGEDVQGAEHARHGPGGRGVWSAPRAPAVSANPEKKALRSSRITISSHPRSTLRRGPPRPRPETIRAAASWRRPTPRPPGAARPSRPAVDTLPARRTSPTLSPPTAPVPAAATWVVAPGVWAGATTPASAARSTWARPPMSRYSNFIPWVSMSQ